MTRILIVDDAVFMRAQLKQMLVRNDFNVVGEAENGQVALHKITELRPDIVTLDITMPVMDGLTCLDEMKKLDYKPTVIMVSAMGHEDSVRQAVLKGAKGFIVKPFKEEVIIGQINKLKIMT